MIVYLRIKNKKIVRIEIDNTSTVKQLKDIIYQKEYVPQQFQWLSFKNKTLFDDEILNELGINDENTIEMKIEDINAPINVIVKFSDFNFVQMKFYRSFSVEDVFNLASSKSKRFLKNSKFIFNKRSWEKNKNLFEIGVNNNDTIWIV